MPNLPKNHYLAPLKCISKRVKRLLITTILILAVAANQVTAQLNKHYFFGAGRNLLMEERYERAVETLNLLLSIDDKLHEALFLRGVAKYNLGDMLGADADFGRAIELNPVYTMAYNARAMTRARIGNYNDALKDFAEAIELRPDIPGAYYNRAIVLLQSGRWEDAMSDLNRFIRREDKVPTAYLMRSHARLALHDTVGARSDVNRAIELNTDSPEGYYRRGLLASERKEWVASLNDMQAAIDRDSTYIPAYFHRSLVHSELGQPRQAVVDLDRVIALDDGLAAAWFNRALLKQQMGSLADALADYNAVARRNPNNVLTYFNRAGLNARLGDDVSAAADYTRAIELYPDFAAAYNMRAAVRARLGDIKGSKSDTRTAQQKIAEYRSKVADSTYSVYADPSRDFSKLVSFDTRFAKGTDTRPVNAAVAIMPMCKFALGKNVKRLPTYNTTLDRFLEQAGDDVLFTTDYCELSDQELLGVEGSDFRRAVAQTTLKQYTAAINLFTDAIEAEPDNGFLYLSRAVARAEMIDFISSLNDLYQMGDDPASRLKSSGVRTWNHDEAMADINKAVRLLPTLAAAYYNRAGLNVVSGRMPEAYDDYTRAIELQPDFAAAYFNRALVQIHLKDTRKGLLDLSKAGELGLSDAYTVLKQYLEE